MGSIVTDAKTLADQLTAAGVRATHDPARAASLRPCVLVTPPSIDYAARTNTWDLAALSSHPAGTLEALDELDELVQQLAQLLPLERAVPRSYPLAADAIVPAYVCTITT